MKREMSRDKIQQFMGTPHFQWTHKGRISHSCALMLLYDVQRSDVSKEYVCEIDGFQDDEDFPSRCSE